MVREGARTDLSDPPCDVQLFSRRDDAKGQVFAFASGSVGLFTTRCPGKESDNEDAAATIAVDASSGLLAVADGLGGAPAGARASQLCLEVLARAVKADGDDELRTRVLDGFEAANRAVTDLGVGAATTLASVEVRGGTIRSYHAGDSMILLVGQRGRIKHQTVPHSPVGYAVESGLLDEEQALHHEDRHLISNMIGSSEMRIEIGPALEMSPRDTLVIGSDGLFDNLGIDEIVEIARKGPLARVVDRLSQACLERMNGGGETGAPSKPDDLTLIVYRRST